jgi:hypothetical protein
MIGMLFLFSVAVLLCPSGGHGFVDRQGSGACVTLGG